MITPRINPHLQQPSDAPRGSCGSVVAESVVINQGKWGNFLLFEG